MLPCSSSLLDNNENEKRRSSVESCEREENDFMYQSTPSKPSIWRPSSLVNLLNPSKKKGSAVFESTPSLDSDDASSRISRTPSMAKVAKEGQSGTIIYVVAVEAKGLPNAPNDGSTHSRYCKITLGSLTLKSKSVSSSQQPVWQERFQFQCTDNLLKVSIWDKGKQKSFMGSCILNLSLLEKERTHEVWQMLDDAYGKIHLSVTMCSTHKGSDVLLEPNFKEKYALLNLSDMKIVGELQVKVVAAKGLSGKPYCLLEVDNERVRTHAVSSSPEVYWDKSFVFNVYDVTSTLDVKVYDSSLVSTLRNDCLGRVTIPLLRINNGEMQWYALKDRSKKSSAKGNCPRVLLEMSLYWNPIKASLKVFQPKEVKYNKRAPKFDIALVYKNVEFVRDTFVSLLLLDEGYRHLFEWESREFSCIALGCWLFFWYFFRMWATPLLLLIPFLYFWIFGRHQQEKSFMRGYGIVEDSSENSGKDKAERSLTGRLQELPDMTITITSGIEFLASLSEKLYNLASFKVPFLSYLTMFLIVITSIGLYLIPFNYIMMAFGLYKFFRKYFDPERVLNNDIVDFLSRIPDTEELKSWKELNVPEPMSPRITRSKYSYG